MAVVKLPDQSQTITHPTDVREFLARHGITFEPWGVERLGGKTTGLPNEEILKAGYADIEAGSPNMRYRKKFIKDYVEAKEHGRGLWK